MTHRRLASLCLVLIAVAAGAAAPLLAQNAAPYTVVESGKRFARLQEAVDAIGGGMGTIRVAPGTWGDCAVQTAGDVLYQAAEPGQATFAGTTCEGKAALVLRGRSARVDGLVFANMAVGDGNGAGIRLEKGNLAVSQAWFRDSQQGILTAGDPAGTITVDKSTFTRLGTCEYSGGCAHGLYIGDYGALTVTRSRFEQGRGGHYLKSRAARVAVLDNSFDDSAGRGTNYMIDLSNGATGRIAGNWMVQGRDKENHSAFIAIAAEGKWHPSAGLAIEGNDARFAPGVTWSSVFVADWSGDALRIGDNALGKGLTRFEKR
ncbi:right-handed parallel beta-helix repeat-containing protein [Novosphingobium flavum]|uniref:Right-handed parallel beta-helix repeat-containing protein n=1 Tax=Novosphingobium flavum TaxID=1778672 RepID=A0A7X1FP53_9SPHN|nr:right-handed parallel beta-helix repeat-containing protein [Novosphingobium flavum]MBC2664401.1 right-handed parallel beta-helix repeat-containing protein [Novosphingobium flavum]